jgi:hypothetical protein
VATVPLLLLILSYIPGLPKAQYIAVCRATGKVTQAAVVLTIATVCELGAVVIGGRADGLNGLTLAYLAVVIVEGLVTAPAVLRTAYARGRMRRAEAQGAAGLGTRTAGLGLPNYLNRQQDGLAALIALATTAVSEGRTLDAATEVWRTGSMPALSSTDTAGPAPAGPAPAGPAQAPVSYWRRQQAGLDALIGLATPVVSDSGPRTAYKE